jgi:hypothetical protein
MVDPSLATQVAPHSHSCAPVRSPAGALMLAQHHFRPPDSSNHCEFSEKFGILEKFSHFIWPIKKAKTKKTVHSVDSVSSQDASENAWFLSNLIYLPGMVPRSQQPPVGHPFLAVGGRKEAPGPPSRSSSHFSTQLATFQWHMGNTPVPLQVHCGRTSQSGPMERGENCTTAKKYM